MNEYDYLKEYARMKASQEWDKFFENPKGHHDLVTRIGKLESDPGYKEYIKNPFNPDNKIRDLGLEHKKLNMELDSLIPSKKTVLPSDGFDWERVNRDWLLRRSGINPNQYTLNPQQILEQKNLEWNRENLTAAQKAENELSETKSYYDFLTKHMANSGKNSLTQRDLLELQYKYDALAAKNKGGKQLTERTAQEIGDITSNLNNWDYLKGLVEENKKQFGFGMGNLRQSLPDMGWNTDAKTLSTKLKREAYDFWRSIDPRLSDQDAVRAIEQIGDLGNTADYTLKQLDFLSKKAQEKAAARIKALELSGYRVPDEFKIFGDDSNNQTSASGQMVEVITPNGSVRRIPTGQLQAALNAGGRLK